MILMNALTETKLVFYSQKNLNYFWYSFYSIILRSIFYHAHSYLLLNASFDNISKTLEKLGTVDLCSNSPNSFFQADTILVLIFRVHIVQSPHEGSLLKLSTSQSRRQNGGETERGET